LFLLWYPGLHLKKGLANISFGVTELDLVSV
jgi:hypothetical protein